MKTRLVCGGLNQRNWLESLGLGTLCLSFPLIFAWLPAIRFFPNIPEDLATSIAVAIAVMVFATGVGGGFTRRREDNWVLFLGMVLVIPTTMLYASGHVSLTVMLVMYLLSLFLITRSLARFVTRQQALKTLARMHSRSWGLPVSS